MLKYTFQLVIKHESECQEGKFDAAIGTGYARVPSSAGRDKSWQLTAEIELHAHFTGGGRTSQVEAALHRWRPHNINLKSNSDNNKINN